MFYRPELVGLFDVWMDPRLSPRICVGESVRSSCAFFSSPSRPELSATESSDAPVTDGHGARYLCASGVPIGT